MQKLSVLILFVGTTFSLSAQKGEIQGEIIYKPDSTALFGATIRIAGAPYGTMSDDFGRFKLKLDEGNYDLVFSFLGFISDTLRNVEVIKDEITEIRLGLPKGNCTKSKKLCQKSNHTDFIVPIVYGFPNEKMMRRAEKEKVFLGGCEITECDPMWYCTKHKVSF